MKAFPAHGHREGTGGAPWHAIGCTDSRPGDHSPGDRAYEEDGERPGSGAQLVPRMGYSTVAAASPSRHEAAEEDRMITRGSVEPRAPS
jgi:hypothetical protein